MTVPIPPQKLSDADLWEHYRTRGLSAEEATLHVERRRSAQPGAKPAPSVPTTAQAALVGAGQGATSGFADELIANLVALHGDRLNPPGRSFVQSRDQNLAAVRDQMSAARGAHPWVAGAANIAGAFLNPLARLLPAATNMERGAVAGTALGGVQGLGEGGGSISERLPSAAVGAVEGAVAGAITGATLGKLVKKYAPVARNTWSSVLRRFRGKGVPTAEAQAAAEIAAETTVRSSLQKAGKSPEVIEQVIQAMRAENHIPTAPGPEVAVTQRPGETVVTCAPRPDLERSTFARRGGQVRQDVLPLTGNRMVSMAQAPGKGETLPWYPRGGQAQQAVAPFPAQAPSGAQPDQTAVFLDYLRGATPQDIPQRVATLRDLGVALPQNAEAQIFQLLFGSP